MEDQFVIAWSAGGQILYLAGDETGIHAVEALEEAARFADYDAGYAMFSRWCSALGALDGAVLLPSETEAQFTEGRASPRRPFYATDDAIAAAQAQAQEVTVSALERAEQAEQAQRRAEAEARAVANKAAALDIIARDYPEMVADALAAGGLSFGSRETRDG